MKTWHVVVVSVMGVAAVVGVGIGAVLAFSGDDGPTKAERDAAAAKASAASASASSVSAEEARVANRQKSFDECTAATSDLLETLGDLNSRLDVGLNYAAYSEKVGDVSVAYDKAIDELVDVDDVCLNSVAVPLENATNRYIDVQNIWSDCIDDYDCIFSEGATNRKVQRKWLNASRFVDRAKDNLDMMEPGGMAPLE